MIYKKHLRGALASFFMATNLYGIPLKIHSSTKIYNFVVEVANTNQKRLTGLMNRPKLSSNQGMLFVFPSKDKHCFWMKETFLSLDILMVNEANVIVDIIHRMKPHSKEIRCSKKAVRRAIELQGGICHDRGIENGDTVEFTGAPQQKRAQP